MHPCRYRKWSARHSRRTSLFPPTDDGSLFTTANGNLHRHEHYDARIFASAVKKAELPPGTTSHALRHHYASVLLAAGESAVAVAERLGHENATLVLKTYGQLMPDAEYRTRRAIDDAWTRDGTQTESDHGWKTSSLVRDQFPGCGRCWIRTNVGISRRFYRPLPLATRATCRAAQISILRRGETIPNIDRPEPTT